MNDDAPSTLEVEIFGEIYHLRGHEDGGYLKDVAGYVDGKMRELAGRVGSVDPARLAVLTALNLSDELFQCRRGQEGERARIEEKAAELVDRLASALNG